jgi:hypothetical protein
LHYQIVRYRDSPRRTTAALVEILIASRAMGSTELLNSPRMRVTKAIDRLILTPDITPFPEVRRSIRS